MHFFTDIFSPPAISVVYINTSSIAVSLSPFPPSCTLSQTTYLATITPSDKKTKVYVVNKTFQVFRGLGSKTSYTISVRVVNRVGNGRPASVTVKTKQGLYIHSCIHQVQYNYSVACCTGGYNLHNILSA